MIQNEQVSVTKTGPWNPGIQSQLPKEVVPFSTLVRPENIFQSLNEVVELTEFTGLQREDVVAFRPERLVVHELLIRMLANYYVSDGDEYEDLGFNFRNMARTVHEKYLMPKMPVLEAKFNEIQQQVFDKVKSELEKTLFAPPVSTKQKELSFFEKLLGKKPPKPAPVISPEQRDAELVQSWQDALHNYSKDSMEYMIYQSLARICGVLMAKYGRIRGEKDMLVSLVANPVCNIYAGIELGEMLEPWMHEGAKQEGYSLLPIQQAPVVMNVKGSSASGKSTLRPLQQKLANALGFRWDEFALISPDIWRKYLLDYESLGEYSKYAGACSGHELKIVDQKLDAYMSRKGEKHLMPHLLIDRFRFDSFSNTSTEKGSNLLTRFGSKVYLFYMITPPHATVERAWKRGVKVGRFKAVDDLLDHNVEAFTGMPNIFFTWALNVEKDVHYEFLDNSVELGQTPKTVAFGENGVLHILDIERIIDIDRFRKIDVNATSRGRVYPLVEEMHESKNTGFLRACMQRLRKVDIVNSKTGEVVARIENGDLKEWNQAGLEKAIESQDARSALLNLFPKVRDKLVDELSEPQFIDIGIQPILGQAGS